MMHSKPEISIIICNYNYARYIGDALESVRNQTFSNWECIVIDDGSTDDSVAIIKSFIKRDKRFRLIQNSHGGTSRARNAGLDAARGDYVAFLDSDDCYTEYALEMLLYIARSTNADMVGGMANMVPEKFKFVPSNGRQVWNAGTNISQGNPVAFLLSSNAYRWCWIWRRIYKRDFIGDVRFNTDFTTFGEDLTFMLELCWRANFVVETPNITVWHRVHGAAITGGEFDEHCFDWFPAYFKYIDEKLINFYDARFWRAYFRSSFMYLLNETIVRPKQAGKYQIQAKACLLKACKYIPKRYLTLRQRILCWFLGFVR